MSLLISIEGLDGVGKSTLASELVNKLSTDNEIAPWVYLSKEPGSKWTGIGPEIRKMVLETPEFKPIERELLFYVDASIHARFVDNQRDALIVSDRGLWSHLAYLRGYLKTKQIDHEDYSLCRKLIDRACRKPDAVIYLRGDLALMEARLAGKEKDVIEQNGKAFYEAVFETYEDLSNNACLPLLTLDATASIGQNIIKVVSWLKNEAFTREELKQGNREVC